MISNKRIKRNIQVLYRYVNNYPYVEKEHVLGDERRDDIHWNTYKLKPRLIR